MTTIAERLLERHRVDSERMWPAPSDLDLLAAAHIKELEEALRSVSTQCGNVIFNCEQRPADNDRHLSSWKGVKEYADAALQPKEPK